VWEELKKGPSRAAHPVFVAEDSFSLLPAVVRTHARFRAADLSYVRNSGYSCDNARRNMKE